MVRQVWRTKAVSRRRQEEDDAEYCLCVCHDVLGDWFRLPEVGLEIGDGDSEERM